MLGNNVRAFWRVSLNINKILLAFVFSLSGQVAYGQSIDVATIGDSVGANNQYRITAEINIEATRGQVTWIGNNGVLSRPTFARSGTTFRQMQLGWPTFNFPGFVDYKNDYTDISFESVVIFGGYNDAVQAAAGSDMVQNALDLQNLVEDINESWDVDTIFVVKLYDLDYDNDPNAATRFESKQSNVDAMNDHIDNLADSIANLETIEVNQFLAPSDYRPDGIHLNGNGQMVAGQRISQALLDFQSVGVLGDVNQDEIVGFSDISPFVALLLTEGYSYEADIDQNEVIDFSDIPPFITLLIGS